MPVKPSIVLPRSMPLPPSEGWFEEMPVCTIRSRSIAHRKRLQEREDSPLNPNSDSDEWEKGAESNGDSSGGSVTEYSTSNVSGGTD